MIANLTDAQIVINEQVDTITDLRAKLAEVERQRDAEHKLAEDRLVLWVKASRLAEKMERERDEARRWAAAWKRSAKMWRNEAYDWTSTTDSIGMGETVGDRYQRVKK